MSNLEERKRKLAIIQADLEESDKMNPVVKAKLEYIKSVLEEEEPSEWEKAGFTEVDIEEFIKAAKINTL